jgi:hypothetical protein
MPKLARMGGLPLLGAREHTGYGVVTASNNNRSCSCISEFQPRSNMCAANKPLLPTMSARGETRHESAQE